MIDLLSPADITLAELLCTGMTTADIATQVERKPETVHNHITRLLRKLGTPTRAGIPRRLIEYGYCTPETLPETLPRKPGGKYGVTWTTHHAAE